MSELSAWEVLAGPADVGHAEPWMSEALCAQTDPEMFFPPKGGSTKQAKKVCVRCDVREQCLEYALRTDQGAGIWGGKSTRERRKLIEARDASAVLQVAS